jgi:hypothetical protein
MSFAYNGSVTSANNNQDQRCCEPFEHEPPSRNPDQPKLSENCDHAANQQPEHRTQIRLSTPTTGGVERAFFSADNKSDKNTYSMLQHGRVAVMILAMLLFIFLFDRTLGQTGNKTREKEHMP